MEKGGVRSQDDMRDFAVVKHNLEGGTMKIRVIFSLLICFCWGCKDHTSSASNESGTLPQKEPDPILPQTGSIPVVSYSVGDRFIYREYITEYPHATDWWLGSCVTKDTTLLGMKWYVINDNFIVLADSAYVFKFVNNSVAVYLNYQVTVGQEIYYAGNILTVDSIFISPVLADTQMVINASNGIFRLSYASKFGIINTWQKNGQIYSRSFLVAARLNGVQYGDSSFLSR